MPNTTSSAKCLWDTKQGNLKTLTAGLGEYRWICWSFGRAYRLITSSMWTDFTVFRNHLVKLKRVNEISTMQILFACYNDHVAHLYNLQNYLHTYSKIYLLTLSSSNQNSSPESWIPRSQCFLSSACVFNTCCY